MNESNCPACRAHQLSSFYSVFDIPVQSCVLLETKEAALAYPRGDLELVLCESCGFISNTRFSEEVQGDIGPYEASQAFSERFSRYQRELCDHLAERHGVRNQDVVEIGSGAGDFLNLLCEVGENRGVGFDPVYAGPERVGGARYVRERFDDRYLDTPSDCIVCRHTLEHVPDVLEFMRLVRRGCGATDKLVFFEVPDVLRVLEEQAFWDVYYEHCSYFAAGPLARLFRRAGFQIEDLSRVYDEQYLVIAARPLREGGMPGGPGGESDKAAALRFEDVSEMERDADRLLNATRVFTEKLATLVEEWQSRLAIWRTKRARVALWGAGSKAAGFLSTLGIAEDIPYIVDVNPRKQGMFQAGTGQEIIAPQQLQAYRPDAVVIMNPIYREEIGRDITAMGLKPELLTL